MKNPQINTLEKFLNITGFTRNSIPSKENIKIQCKLNKVPKHIKIDILTYFLY